MVPETQVGHQRHRTIMTKTRRLALDSESTPGGLPAPSIPTYGGQEYVPLPIHLSIRPFSCCGLRYKAAETG